jgi:UDPglucose 6-dehydrogenase
MKICVLGTGYVGLVSAAVFSELGNEVVGLDIDESKVKSLRAGKITIYEPGLDQLVSKNIDSGRLSFTTSYKEALKDVEVILICVGTPPKPDGSYDSQFVYAAAESIAKNLTREAVIVIKSTVPPSTSQKVQEIISQTAKVKFSVASVPEFLREGQAVNDALHPNRVVIGVDSPKAERVLAKLHEKFKAPILVMAPESAQLVKYASNAFLATKISFINAIAILADKVGADVMDVAKGLGMDPRIGAAFLNPGLGYGGSCFPKDTWALISFAKKLGYDFKFLKEVDQVNNLQVDYLIDKIESALGKLNTKTVSILGLAFKPNTDDTREARSTVLISKLKKLGVLVKTYDPIVKGDYDDVYLALTNSDALVLVTEWSEFDELDWQRVKRVMRQPNVFDGRNALNPEKLKKLGFNYWGIGRR